MRAPRRPGGRVLTGYAPLPSLRDRVRRPPAHWCGSLTGDQHARPRSTVAVHAVRDKVSGTFPTPLFPARTTSGPPYIPTAEAGGFAANVLNRPSGGLSHERVQDHHLELLVLAILTESLDLCGVDRANLADLRVGCECERVRCGGVARSCPPL
jgi:hypothetical protein